MVATWFLFSCGLFLISAGLLLNLCSPCGGRSGPWKFRAFILPAEGASRLLGNTAEPYQTHGSEQNQHYPTRLSKGGVLFISDFFFFASFFILKYFALNYSLLVY